ncbi:hypothetical protein [Aquipseudomonas alcaligenes]
MALTSLLPWMQVALSEPNSAVIKSTLALQGLIADELAATEE